MEEVTFIPFVLDHHLNDIYLQNTSPTLSFHNRMIEKISAVIQSI